jgi:hypothetical protein
MKSVAGKVEIATPMGMPTKIFWTENASPRQFISAWGETSFHFHDGLVGDTPKWGILSSHEHKNMFSPQHCPEFANDYTYHILCFLLWHPFFTDSYVQAD